MQSPEFKPQYYKKKKEKKVKLMLSPVRPAAAGKNQVLIVRALGLQEEKANDLPSF
jgi:hypothetical protein